MNIVPINCKQATRLRCFGIRYVTTNRVRYSSTPTITKRRDDARPAINTQQESFHLAFGAAVYIQYLIKVAGVSRIGYSVECTVYKLVFLRNPLQQIVFNQPRHVPAAAGILRIGYSSHEEMRHL